MSMRSHNIRFHVLLFSFFLAVGIYIWITATIPPSQSRISKLTETYALCAASFLYLALLVSPILHQFPRLPFRGDILKARRAIGFSAFLFAVIHTSFAFFGELGGFAGLPFLSNKYLLAGGLGLMALIILTLMASTSFDFMVAKLRYRKWKMLHRFVYLAGLALIIHILMLGTHFVNVSSLIPQIFFILLTILLLLEGLRFDDYLQKRYPVLPRIGLSTTIVCIAIFSLALLSLLPSSGDQLSFNIHSAHIQIAKDAQNNTQFANQQNIPGLVGDRTKRYTVSFTPPTQVTPNQDTELHFQVYDAASGNKVALFQRVYEKVIHLIIVDNELVYFNHIHPEQTDNDFSVTTSFPHSGKYHLYLDFQPLGAIEQQFGFTIDVGDVQNPVTSTIPPDENLSKTFGNYQVSMQFPKPLKSDQISIGNQKFTFTINDKNGQPITTLKPYLAAFGHLVMINESTYEYIHVHPNNLVAPKPDQNGGPTVEFLPLGLYGPIKPGIYRVFAQFNPDNNLFTSDFTMKVE
jgi:DMSO/TMAO reductase YedYZ heme-binding membrane subunit